MHSNRLKFQNTRNILNGANVRRCAERFSDFARPYKFDLGTYTIKLSWCGEGAVGT